MRKIYAVRSAEWGEPLDFGTFDNLLKAKEFINRLMVLDEEDEDLDEPYEYDYDIVWYFDSVDEAMEYTRQIRQKEV